MSSLNQDLIREIAAWAIYDRDFAASNTKAQQLKDLVNFQRVCRQWKATLEHYPSLWAASVDFFGQQPDQLEKILSRSKNALLETGHSQHLQSVNFPLECAQGHPTLNRIIAELDRIWAVRFSFAKACCLERLVTALGLRPLPNLKECKLAQELTRGFNVSWPVSRNGPLYDIKAPSLRTIHFYMFPINVTSLATAKSLRMFHWHGATSQFFPMVETLRNLPRLRSCSIRVSEEWHTLASDEKAFKNRVCLPDMVDLDLYAPLDFVRAFFAGLSVPPGTHVDIVITRQFTIHTLRTFFDVIHTDRFTTPSTNSGYQRRLEIGSDLSGTNEFTLVQETISNPTGSNIIIPGRTSLKIRNEWIPNSGLDADFILDFFDLAGPDLSNVVELSLYPRKVLNLQSLTGLHSRLDGFTNLRLLRLSGSCSQSVLDVFEQFNPNIFPSLETIEEIYGVYPCTTKHVQKLVKIFRARQVANWRRCQYIAGGVRANQRPVLESSSLREVLDVTIYASKVED